MKKATLPLPLKELKSSKNIMIHSKAQKQVLQIMKKFVPKKEFGIRAAYYKIPNKKSLDFLFVIDEEAADRAVNYIQALSSSLESRFKNLEIEVSLYIHEAKTEAKIERFVQKEEYQPAELALTFA